MYFKLQIQTCVSILSPVPLTNLLAKFSRFSVHMLNLPPNTDPFVLLTHIFDTYRTLQYLLQLHSTDIQNLTLSTIHVNDFLKKLILLGTPPQLTSS